MILTDIVTENQVFDIYMCNNVKHFLISTLISTERILMIFNKNALKKMTMIKVIQTFVEVQFPFTSLHLRFMCSRNMCQCTDVELPILFGI